MVSSYIKRKRVVIRPRFYLFLVVILALVVWLGVALVKFFSPPVVEWGNLSTDLEISAIIVREEQVISSSENGKFENIVTEGDTIEQGQEVAILYSTEFSEDDYDMLIDVRQDIKNYQEESILKNVIYEDVDNLDEEIDSLIVEISDLIRAGDDRILPAKEHRLKTLMEERRAYLNENLHEDSNLSSDFLREEVLLEKIEKSMNRLYAPAPGLISFFIDGLEEYLTLEKVEAINNDDFVEIENRILNSTVESNINEGSIVNIDQPIYRIITPNHWYAIIKIPRNKNTLITEGTCDITFENYGHTISNVYVKDVRQYGKESVIVLELSSDIGPLASLRIVSGNLGRSNEGLKVPIEYVTQYGSEKGIWIINEDKTESFIPVNIIAQDYYEAIIEAASGYEDKIQTGQRLKEP